MKYCVENVIGGFFLILLTGQLSTAYGQYSLEVSASASGLIGERVAVYGNVKDYQGQTVDPDNVMWDFGFDDSCGGGCGAGSPSSGSGTTYMGTRRWITEISDDYMNMVIFEVEAWYGGSQLSATVSISIEKPKVTSVDFENNIPLKSDLLPITWAEWQQTLNETTPNTDEPACYVRSSNASAELKIKASSSLSYAAYVEVKGNKVGSGNEDFYSESAIFHHWSWSNNELLLGSSTLHYAVHAYDTLDVAWQYRVWAQGGWGGWQSLNQTNHTLFTIYETPRISTPQTVVVEKIAEYAEGKYSIATISQAICEGIADDIKYDPSPANVFPYDDEWRIYQDGAPPSADALICWQNAELMETLIESVCDQDCKSKSWWGGHSSSSINLFEDNGENISFQLVTPAEDSQPANLTLIFHVTAEVSGVDYDPSFGTVGSPQVLGNSGGYMLAKSGQDWYDIVEIENPSTWTTRSGTSSAASLRSSYSEFNMGDTNPNPATRVFHDDDPSDNYPN